MSFVFDDYLFLPHTCFALPRATFYFSQDDDEDDE